MADYWNSVEIVNADISGSAPQIDNSSSSASVVEAKAWGNDDTTVKIGEADQGDEAFRERARNLMPPFYKTQSEKVDEETLNWEVQHKKQKAKIRRSTEYKFAMLIAGAANLKIERIWTTSSEDPKIMGRGEIPGSTTESGDSFLTPAPQMDNLARTQAFQHQWTQVPEVSMEIHLSPQVYFQVQESLNMVQRHPRARHITVQTLIRNAGTRTLFAGLVALNMKFSNFMSGINYQLDANYTRLKRERNTQIIRLVSAVKKSSSFLR